jgi:hypothetical protein
MRGKMNIMTRKRRKTRATRKKRKSQRISLMDKPLLAKNGT